MSKAAKEQIKGHKLGHKPAPRDLTDWLDPKINPPTMIGEYNASMVRSPHARRWWDGKNFSLAYECDDLEAHKIRHAGSTSAMSCILYRGLKAKP